MQSALSAAQAEAYQRVFLDAGMEMFALLRSVLPHLQGKPLVTYGQTLLDAFEREDGIGAGTEISWQGESLTPQELRVLRLLVTGKANSAIAAELVVSVNTVKAHVKSIYRKLQVSDRVAAIAAAKNLRLE